MFGVTVFLKEDEESQDLLVAAQIDTMASNAYRGAHKHPNGKYTMELGHSLTRSLLDLKRGRIPEGAIKYISFDWGRDSRFTEKKVKSGVYEYEGATIAIRWFHNSNKDGSWRQADISVDCPTVKSFEVVFKLLSKDDFSTEMFEG